MREGSGMCGYTPKGVTRREVSMLSIEKSTGVQQCIGYATEKHSNREERVEHKMGDSNVCRVWWVPIERHKNKRKLGARIYL